MHPSQLIHENDRQFIPEDLLFNGQNARDSNTKKAEGTEPASL